MKVVIIGSGNVATVMGARIVRAGHRIVQVAGRRTMTSASASAVAALAEEWGSGHVTDYAAIVPDADLYIVAVSDTALEGLGDQLQLPGRLVVHTAGAAPAEVLRPVSDRFGVLYPLQSLRREIRPFPEFPLLIDSNHDADLDIIGAFAHSISTEVQRAGDDQRLKLHVAAVLINNFSNYLYTLSADFCRQEGVDFSMLLPIIRETAARLEHYPPQDVQTGPAIRGDAGTMSRHLELLSNYDNISELYRIFSAQIGEYYRSRSNDRTGHGTGDPV